MNKKGYTLIEILVVVAVIVAIGLTSTIGLTKVINNSKQNRYDDMVKDIELATNTYLAIYPDMESSLYTTGSISISILDLQNALLIDENLKNPKDNSEVSGNVVVTYNSTDESVAFTVELE